MTALIAPQENDRPLYWLQISEKADHWLSPSAVAIFENHGFISTRGEPGFYELSGPDNTRLLQAAFEEMDTKSFISLKASLTKISKPLREVLSVAHKFHRLKMTCAEHDPDYPLGKLMGLPFSFPLNEKLIRRFDELLSDLETRNISLRFGVEMEFALGHSPIEGHEKTIDDIAIRLIEREHQSFLQAGNSEESTHHLMRLTEIRNFALRDFLMMHLLEEDEVTSGIFEHCFGTGEGGNGYYDNELMLELRTRILDGREFLSNYLSAQSRVIEKVFANRFQIVQQVGQQLSVSVWQDGRNLTLCETPEDEAFTQRMARSLGFMMEQGQALIFSSKYMNSNSGLPLISPSRLSIVRHAYGRFEMKGFGEEGQHLVLGAIMGAGAALAANDLEPSIDKAARTSRIIVPGISFPENSFPWLRHAFTASAVDPRNGNIKPDAEYIKMSATKILHQVNPGDARFNPKIANKNDKTGLPESPALHQEAVTKLISLAKVFQDESGCHFRWPEKSVIILSQDTMLDTDNLNANTKCLGLSPRFEYPAALSMKIGEKIKALRDHPLLPGVFGGVLYGELLDAFEQERSITHEKFEMLSELVGNVGRALQAEPQDNGQGLVLLVVPIHPKPRGVAERSAREVLKMLREPGSPFEDIFNCLQFAGMAMKVDQNTVTDYMFYLPVEYYQGIAQAMSGVATKSLEHEVDRSVPNPEPQ